MMALSTELLGEGRDAHWDRQDASAAFREVRSLSETLAEPLAPEDQVVQSMPDASPTKWHLAHVSWFFETFLLEPHLAGYQPLDSRYRYLFNSYYEAVGPCQPRPERGLLTRPTVGETATYRRHVDDAMERLIDTADSATWAAVEPLIELGLHHEQQHQELLLTDIKHAFSCNPLLPAYAEERPRAAGDTASMTWFDYRGGVVEIGHDGGGFAFDNEGPRHATYLRPFRLAARPVANRELLAFVDDGGYHTPVHWLSDGWATVQQAGWRHPIYWRQQEGEWYEFTLSGLRPLDLGAPVCHVSYYEADAFARWAGKRLPTEAEWETAASTLPPDGNLLPSGRLHPVAADATVAAPMQMFGDVWEWTQSPYAAYPGFRPGAGAIGEYNGKFMCNQFVLRGGSCVTPGDHVRATYRNFFPPESRWQFGGLRLAEDL